MLEATRSGEGLEVFCPPMPEVGDQVGLDNKGEGEPRADGDACASLREGDQKYLFKAGLGELLGRPGRSLPWPSRQQGGWALDSSHWTPPPGS